MNNLLIDMVNMPNEWKMHFSLFFLLKNLRLNKILIHRPAATMPLLTAAVRVFIISQVADTRAVCVRGFCIAMKSGSLGYVGGEEFKQAVSRFQSLESMQRHPITQ